MDKVCPNCGERYQWYEAECPNCHVALVDAPDEQNRLNDLKLTVVFTTSEPGLVPLANLALEQRGIEYVTRLQGKDSMSAGGRAYRGEGANEPVEILVREEDAATAADLLKDLQDVGSSAASPAPSSPAPLPPVPTPSDAVVSLVDLSTNQPVGRITNDDLEWLNSQLEKESEDDRDYYFDRPTLDMLDEKGASRQLMAVLRGALGARDEMDLQWSRR